ncbi:MAG: polysaccharide biosynthesis protein [Puniceicoccales bacterium]|jgi:FlaA1/EpsC-like NDP-sugar epimerase|nr:polysaccharide biosynthesis protein [Puniceicoccales bacterium]
MNFFRKHFGHVSLQRTSALVIAYLFLLAFALFNAYAMRFAGLDEWEVWKRGFLGTVFWLVPVQIGTLFAFRHFSGMLSYFRMPELVRVVQALFIALLVACPIRYIQQVAVEADNAAIAAALPTADGVSTTATAQPTDTTARSASERGEQGERGERGARNERSQRLNAPVATPWTVIFADFIFAVIAVCAVRVLARMLHEYAGARDDSPVSETTAAPRRVAILGAGDAGASLAANWLARPGLRKQPVVFLDDNVNKHGLRVHNIPVEGPVESLGKIKMQYGIDEVVIAVGAASMKRFNAIVELTRKHGFHAEVVPSLLELASGRVKPSRIRPVDIQDLLGREPVPLDSDAIGKLIAGKTVLVTGAGGSIGSELCRQIASRTPRRLLLVERCEVQLFKVEQDLLNLGYNATVLPLVGDIADEERMRHILAFHKPDLIFHAAAHKHVYLMERQPAEAVRNNTLGTRLLANLAVEYGVKHFILISTDKAINPTSVMGASKRMAEIYTQAKGSALARNSADSAADAETADTTTKFVAVRFGNVLGSSGSVIPLFREQIAEGGPVKVTHPEVTRYFMTIPEAVGLVLQCAVLGQGGEVFVLNMGQPVKILDMARQMIELSGLRPDVDIQIEFVGLRPGEKLFEELQYTDEWHTPTTHPSVMCFKGDPRSLAEVNAAFDALAENITEKTSNALKLEVKRIVPEYTPHLSE